jgi:hypothetical protein
MIASIDAKATIATIMSKMLCAQLVVPDFFFIFHDSNY